MTMFIYEGITIEEMLYTQYYDKAIKDGKLDEEADEYARKEIKKVIEKINNNS